MEGLPAPEINSLGIIDRSFLRCASVGQAPVEIDVTYNLAELIVSYSANDRPCRTPLTISSTPGEKARNFRRY